MPRTEWPTRDRDEKPLEVAPIGHGDHLCEVAWKKTTPWDGLNRPVGTCWRCPECWTWWVARRWCEGVAIWKPVRFLSHYWWRCRRAAKELR